RLILAAPEGPHRNGLQAHPPPERAHRLGSLLARDVDEDLARNRPTSLEVLLLHVVGQPRQRQRVRDVRPALVDDVRQIGVRVPALLRKRREGFRLLERREVLALDVLLERDLEEVVVAQDRRDEADARDLGRARIDSASSFKVSGSKYCRGWSGFGLMHAIGTAAKTVRRLPKRWPAAATCGALGAALARSLRPSSADESLAIAFATSPAVAVAASGRSGVRDQPACSTTAPPPHQSTWLPNKLRGCFAVLARV